jgi:Tfp pilus assembly protein PilF/DNA-binding MarR family transcriptional regulator
MATTLSQISIYNPQRLSDESIENLYIVRLKVFNFLMNKIHQETATTIPQHHLIIAQRGMGKSTLLKRIEVELRKENYKHDFIPLLFPEEQYNIGSLADLWLNSLDALADALEIQNEKEKTTAVDKKIDELQKLKHQDDIAQQAFDFLVEFTSKYHVRPVLLIDNINLIFDRLDKSAQHKLRAWLMKNGAPIIIGASVTTIEDTFEYGAPFYDAFQFQYLNKLNFDELMEILHNLAAMTNAPEVSTAIHAHKARLKTICQLTGGNPRTANLLYRLILKGFSKEISDDLEGILDEITPLYKARFEELSPQLQIIVDAIALHWDPINIEQLRAKTSMQNAQLSPQLKRLVEAGWIEKIDSQASKGNAYEISERFFNIWFIMRRSSRRQKKELYCLSRFLESMYGEELQEYAKDRLNFTSKNTKDVYYNLAIAEALKDEKLSKKLKEKTINDLKALAKIHPEVLKEFDLYELTSQKEFEKFEESIAKIITVMPTLAYPWLILGHLYHTIRKRYKEAEKAYKKAIEIDKENGASWIGLGNLYKDHLVQYEDAEKAYKKAIELDEKNNALWVSLGNLYQNQLKQYEDAEKAYKNAQMQAQNNVSIKYNLVFLYRDKMNKPKEAKELFDTIPFSEELADSYYLNKSLFDLYKKNESTAKEYVAKALEFIIDRLPLNTQDDWWRFGAIATKLGYASWFLQIMEDNGFDIVLSPYYVAIKALNSKDRQGYINSKAVEIREAARHIMGIMERYNSED